MKPLRLFLLPTLLFFSMTSSLRADEIQQLGGQLRAYPLPFKALTGDISGEQALRTMRADGTWADIDYTDDKDWRVFTLAAHLRRANLILDSADTAPTPEERTRRREAAHRALAGWVRMDPKSIQGWYQTIGVPQLFGRLMLGLEDELTPAEKAYGLALFRRCVREDGELIYNHAPATGQNLQWQAALQIVGGYFERDPERIERHVRRIEREMQITVEEGIQPDLSFQQHGRQLYAGGYGLNFTTDAARLAVQVRGTRFALTDESVNLLTRFLLDGQQGMLRGRTWAFTAIGREIARAGRDAFELAVAADQLATFEGPRAGELRSFARRVRGEEPAGGAPSKFRVFWRSDFVSQTRPKFYFSVRMTSTRMNGSEAGNGENELGCYLGDGATTLMRAGDEYRGIFPLWDWRRIPGVTNAYQPDVPLPIYTWSEGFEAGSDFAGGAGDDENGLAAMTLNRLGVHAGKAWFFQGDTVVCLGAGIRADDPKAPLITTLDQCRARGELTKGDGWVRHDGVTYRRLDGGALHAQVERRTGSWRTVDRLQGSAEPVTGDVFTAWIEHGADTASYAYRIEIGEAADAPRVLVNTETVQAVASAAGDLVQAVFRAAGEVRLPDGRTLAVDAPSLVQWRRGVDGREVLVVGNPTQKVAALKVGVGTRRVEFFFPKDAALAGRPIMKEVD